MTDQKQDPKENKENYVKVGDEAVFLNPEVLTFDEARLNQYLQEEAGWYNYYGQKLADAESYLQWFETQYDVRYSTKFRFFKDEGGSDKMAEAKAKADPEVETAKKAVIAGKRSVKKLQQYLRAFDKSHDNAQSFGHMLRREMDKLQNRINAGRSAEDAELERQVEEIVKAAPQA